MQFVQIMYNDCSDSQKVSDAFLSCTITVAGAHKKTFIYQCVISKI